MEIKHTCSLGTLCHSSALLKNNKLKLYSCPFDWIFSNPKNIISIIENNFKLFLNKKFYKSINGTTCGHSLYHEKMFRHHNPLKNEDHYNYFVRCVERFKKLMNNMDSKLFVIINVNNNEALSETTINNMINFNNKFKLYTTNYRILYIHNKCNQNQFFNFKTIDNLDFLELNTLSKSNGVHFEKNIDNIYLNNIINKKYKFNVSSL